MHGEELVIGVGGDKVGLRRQQLEANQPGKRTADEKEKRDRNEVQDPDTLVVLRQQPAENAVLIVQVISLWDPGRALVRKGDNCRGAAHGFIVSWESGVAGVACVAGKVGAAWLLSVVTLVC